MAKSNVKVSGSTAGIAAVVIVVLAFVFFYHPTTGSIAGGGGIPGTNTNPTGGQTACNPPAVNQILKLSATYVNQVLNPPIVTAASTTYAIYDPSNNGGQISVNSISTSTTDYIYFPSTGTTGCNHVYNILFGDDSSYFYSWAPGINTGVNTSTIVARSLFKYTAETVQSGNTPNTFATNAVVYATGAGANTIRSGYISIAAGSQFSAIPGANGGMVVICTFNSVAVSSCKPNGASSYLGSLPPLTYVSDGAGLGGTQSQAQAWLLPGQLSNTQYATPYGQVGSQTAGAIQMVITTTSVYAINEPIGVYTEPLTGYVLNGQFINGTLVNNNGAALITPVSNTRQLEIHPTAA